MKTQLIFVEASLEKIPKTLWKHPSVISDSKRRRRHPSKILLYVPIHYTALKKYNIPTGKKGRPDILHRSLITALDSPFNKEGQLNIYVHTQENILISVNSSIRIPLNYYRFEGLMIQLLEEGRIPPNGKDSLMKIEDANLLEFIRKNKRDIYILSRRGKMINKEIVSNMMGNSILIGAFQDGEISREIMKEANHVISISPYTHLASTVTCYLLTYLYQNINIR